MEEMIEVIPEDVIINGLTVGTVEVVDIEEVEVSIVGESPHQIINFKIPRANVGYYEDLVNKPTLLTIEDVRNFIPDYLSSNGFNPSENNFSNEDKEKLNTAVTNIEENKNRILSNKLKHFQKTLTASNWTLNETNNKYEYDISNTNITSNHYGTVNPSTSADNEKVDGTIDAISYDGGIKLITETPPMEDISVEIYYQLCNEEEVIT